MALKMIEDDMQHQLSLLHETNISADNLNNLDVETLM